MVAPIADELLPVTAPEIAMVPDDALYAATAVPPDPPVTDPVCVIVPVVALFRPYVTRLDPPVTSPVTDSDPVPVRLTP